MVEVNGCSGGGGCPLVVDATVFVAERGVECAVGERDVVIARDDDEKGV